MKKVLSIILAIVMIVTTVPMAFATEEFAQQSTSENGVTGYTVGDHNAPLIVNITGKEYISIGQGTAYYDEDGYIITGKSEIAQIDVTESCDITLENTTFCTMYLIGNKADVKLTLVGESFCGSSENERPGINIYNSNLIIEGGEDDSLTYNGIREMICSSGQSGTFTVNSGKIISNTETDKNYGSIECSNFVINGGEVTLSTNYSHICKTVLNGGVLNIIATSSENVAINTDIIMKKGSLLTVRAEGEILSSWYGFDGFDANILMADGAEETDYFFVRYDKTGEFTPVMDIRAALNGKNYVEIKTDAHEHFFGKAGRCICGYECLHKNLADNKCSDCGAEGDLVIITMTDIFGDDWEDNAIVIEEIAGEESKVIAKTSLSSSQEDNTYIIFFNDYYAYRFKWINGYWPAECAFTVTINGENVYEVSGVSLADGEVFYSYCKHSFENGKCTKCGIECGVDLEHTFEDYTCTICGKYTYKIVHQPTAEELFVAVNNDIGASFQWCTVSYASGEKVYSAVDGQTYSYLENPVGGNEYACIVTFKDGTTETSESVKIHGCDFSGEWKSDGEKHWKECECGNIGEEAAHSYDDNIWESNEEGHQAKCKCGYKATAEEHEFYDSVCVKCSFCCDHIIFEDDTCKACGYKCRHEIMISEIITRPVQNDDGTWSKGTANSTCSLCKKAASDIEIERDHEGYKLFDEACDKLELLLDRDDILESDKKEMQKSLENIINKAYQKVYTDVEKNDLASLKEDIEEMTEKLENGLADGTMKKADFSELKALLDEINELIKGDTANMISEMADSYLAIARFYDEYSDDPTCSQNFYDWALESLECEALIVAIRDGSALKADYTEIDKAISEIEEKLTDENIKDEAKTGLEKIKTELNEMKADENTSAADLAELEKALGEYEAEIDNCINGVHNGLKFEVTEEAECGKNAVEAATCTLCGEVLERDVEDTALTHSFTKYETVEEAKCDVVGKEVAYCDNGCGESDQKDIDALTHTDTDGDYLCDNGCGYEYEKTEDPTPDEPTTDEPTTDEPTTDEPTTDEPIPDEPTPDEPTPDETTPTCEHICHKTGILGFFWKIIKFFTMLFKINPVCECGVAHF